MRSRAFAAEEFIWGSGFKSGMKAGRNVEAVKPITFSGQGFSLVGEKGRFVLPPELRKAVRESGQGERLLCLAKHPRWKCLTGFGLSRADQLEDELDREEAIALERGNEFDRDERAQQLYGFTRIPFDDSGRFVLPERYFKLGGLTDRLFFQGGGKMFTIWNPVELAKMGTGWEDAQEACADLEAQALAGKTRK